MSDVSTDSSALKTLIEDAYNGKIVVPDFQRSFVWDPEQVRELLVSVVGGYYIGSLLTLRIQKSNSPFAIKLIEGVENINPKAKPGALLEVLLDGQQRISSLFYAFYQPEIGLRNQKNAYYFFLNVEKAIKGIEYFDESVIGVSSNHRNMLAKLRADNSIIEFKYLKDAIFVFNKFGKHKKAKEIINLIDKISNYKISIIGLPDQTPVERIVETFERINRTGKPLTIFELLTARLYQKKIKLRELLDETYKKYPELNRNEIEPETILRVMALYRSKDIGKKTVLNIKPIKFEEDWDKATHALYLAYKKITSKKTGYGVLGLKKWMPYNSMIVPLAGLILHLKDEKKDTKSNNAKIDTWYWCSVFNERYEQSSNTIASQDYKEMLEYFRRNTCIPKAILEFNAKEIDYSVESTGSGIYRGIMNMLTIAGAFDFYKGLELSSDPNSVQDDHIFPNSIFNENSILNKTLILSNQKKSKKRPSVYFNSLIDSHKENELIKILKTHLISKNALTFLLNDDLKNFMNERKKTISANIAKLVQI
jgi:hypothetical protein